jgi:hypothetical protein
MLVFNLRFLNYPYNSYETNITKKIIEKSTSKFFVVKFYFKNFKNINQNLDI